jgi:hypothetical protein
LKSRVAISRFSQSHRSSEGQAARDLGESGLGTSAFSKLKGVWKNSEAPSCDGSHGDGAEHNTWHRILAFGVLKGKGITTFHLPIS